MKCRVKLSATSEAYQFNGSSSQEVALKTWIAGNEYIAPTISTRDIKSFMCGIDDMLYEIESGDWLLLRIDDGKREFIVVENETFENTFEAINDE